MEAFFHLGALGEIISFAYNIEPILSIRPFDMYNTDHGEIPTMCNCFQCLRLRIKKSNLLSQPFNKKSFFFLNVKVKKWKKKMKKRRRRRSENNKSKCTWCNTGIALNLDEYNTVFVPDVQIWIIFGVTICWP